MIKIQYTQKVFKLFQLLFTINLVFISAIPVNAEKRNLPNTVNRRQQNKPRNPENTIQRRRQPQRKLVYFKQPQRQGTPQGTRPAGSRNGCSIAQEIPVTALVPVTKQTDGRQLHWGLTTKEHPTFWFYIPYPLKSLKNAKFSLRNRQKQTIYETQLQLTDAPGVIHVSLPTKAPSLEVNQWYQYYLFLDINCTSNQFLSKEVTQAWVKRETINPTIQTQLETMSPSQQGLFYAQNGIWYDAIASFAEIKLTSGINSYWSEILESIGFGKIAHLKPTNCCEFSPTSDR